LPIGKTELLTFVLSTQITFIRYIYDKQNIHQSAFAFQDYNAVLAYYVYWVFLTQSTVATLLFFI